MTNKALRVIGFAYKINNEDLIFTGLMGLIDPQNQTL